MLRLAASNDLMFSFLQLSQLFEERLFFYFNVNFFQHCIFISFKIKQLLKNSSFFVNKKSENEKNILVTYLYFMPLFYNIFNNNLKLKFNDVLNHCSKELRYLNEFRVRIYFFPLKTLCIGLFLYMCNFIILGIIIFAQRLLSNNERKNV